jgi:hypothetical protein
VLGDARFLRLLIGNSVSSFGDSALYLSLGVWAKDLTGSNAAAGAIFLAQGLPCLAAPLAGQLTDRVRRRPLLIVTNAIAGAAVLALLIVHSRADLWGGREPHLHDSCTSGRLRRTRDIRNRSTAQHGRGQRRHPAVPTTATSRPHLHRIVYGD